MKIQYSGLGISDGRGKLGGTIFSENRYGPFAAPFVPPTNPQTPPQLDTRTRFSQVTGFWSTDLSEAEREDWNAAGELPEWEQTPSFGPPYQPSGFELFCKLNLSAFEESFPIRTPPTYPTITPITLQTIQLSAGIPTPAVRLIFNEGNAANEITIVWATFTNSTGINRPRWSLHRQVYRDLVNAPEFVATCTDLYNDFFGGAIEDLKAWFFIQVMDVQSGVRLSIGRAFAIAV